MSNLNLRKGQVSRYQVWGEDLWKDTLDLGKYVDTSKVSISKPVRLNVINQVLFSFTGEVQLTANQSGKTVFATIPRADLNNVVPLSVEVVQAVTKNTGGKQ